MTKGQILYQLRNLARALLSIDQRTRRLMAQSDVPYDEEEAMHNELKAVADRLIELSEDGGEDEDK